MTRNHDKGAAAITLALSMLLLLGSAAIALDLSNGWNEKRQDQTASDLGTMAGALSFGNNDAIVTEVMATSRANVDTVYTDAEWDALWVACVDTDRPPAFTPIVSSSLGTIDCISLNPSFVRARLPDQLTDTSFGRLLGVDLLTTHADTIVTLLPEGGTGLLPFAVAGDATSGEICLDTGTGQIAPPCDGNESGSFGNIAPPLFGNTFISTLPECGQQTSNNNHVAESIAMGVDHFIFSFSSGDWMATGWGVNDNTSNNNVDALVNMDECIDVGGTLAAAADGIPIQGVYVDTGNNVNKAVEEGLITGIGYQDGLDARLTRTTGGPTLNFAGFALDNEPLWTHLGAEFGPGGHGLPYCDGPTVRGAATIDLKNDAMRACLETYELMGASVQIFADTILNSPRLGATPRLWHYNLGSGISYRPVKRFDVVYIHGIWLDDDNANPTIFFPGAGSGPIVPQKANWKLEQVTAFLLLDSMVSQEVLDIYPGGNKGLLQPTIYE